jgi:hypothetical protein
VHAKPKVSSQPAGMTVTDVIKLSKAGLSEDIIIEQIRKNGKPFQLTTGQLIQLKTASVSSRVVQFMFYPAQVEVPADTLSATASKAAAALPATVSAAKVPAAAEAAIPTEWGVYVKEQGQWTEVPPEIVYWKTGGAFKAIATAGIVRGDVNGHLSGVASQNAYAAPMDFLIVLPEGTSINEYQLLRLRVNKGNREFRTVTGGVLHSEGGPARDAISFEPKKTAAHAFLVHFGAVLGVGEYAFLPPGSSGMSGKVYSFRVVTDDEHGI